MVGGEVMVLGGVLIDAVELPAGRVELGQLRRRNRVAEAGAGLGERGTGPGADRPPAIFVDRSVAEHLEVLGVVAARRCRVDEGLGEAHALDGRLGHAADRGRRLDAEQVEDRRHHIDDVRVLRADLSACLDTDGPGDDERVGRAAAVGFALPAPERRVAGPRPTPGIVVEVVGPADLSMTARLSSSHSWALLKNWASFVVRSGRLRRSPRCRR